MIFLIDALEAKKDKVKGDATSQNRTPYYCRAGYEHLDLYGKTFL